MKKKFANGNPSINVQTWYEQYRLSLISGEPGALRNTSERPTNSAGWLLEDISAVNLLS